MGEIVGLYEHSRLRSFASAWSAKDEYDCDFVVIKGRLLIRGMIDIWFRRLHVKLVFDFVDDRGHFCERRR